MWIQIVENDSDKYLINFDKVCTIVKDDDGDEPGIMIIWSDETSAHYDVSYDDVAEQILKR